MLSDLHLMPDPNLIVGVEKADDAGVYKLSDDLAIVQTVDFFTPIVDDPYAFGQIAVANALSDVYAMGGRPLVAMNLVCFPINKMDISILSLILDGGLNKMHEAGVTLVGGHTVEDPELKYGLSVTGVVHPERVVTRARARAGDRLILTKPLGVGIISTALKGGMVDEATISKVTGYMAALNRKASELMTMVGVNAATDITGFGLLGHASEMVESSDIGMVLNSSSIPFFPEAKEFAEMELVPGELYRNREFCMDMVEIDPGIPNYLVDILFDPQTSGGLLISVPGQKGEMLLKRMHDEGIKEATIIGEVKAEPKRKIIIK